MALPFCAPLTPQSETSVALAALEAPAELGDWLRMLTLDAYSEGGHLNQELMTRRRLFVPAADQPVPVAHSRIRIDASSLNARLLETLDCQRRLHESLQECSATSAAHGTNRHE